MAKELKVKIFSISTEEDITTLRDFFKNVSSIESMIQYDGKILVVYKKK